METIGSRIKQLRKSRGMTQDQLAERIGVSPQAVSKWENDISSPDISLLPGLAEIFQVTTDSLLGVPEKTEIVPAPPKHTDPVDPEAEEEKGHSGLTFQIDLGNQDLPWLATAVLLFALGLLLNRTLLASLGEASIWDLMWPAAMTGLGLSSLSSQINLWSVGMTGFGGYYLLVNMHILQRWDTLSWKIIVPVLLVLWALSMYVEHFRGNGRRVHMDAGSCSENCSSNGELRYDGCFGSETISMKEPVFRGGEMDVSFGNYTLDLTACRTVEPGSKLELDASFGSVTLLLPENWKVQERTDRSFSSVSTYGSPAADADQLLMLECDLSFGRLEIRW